MTEAQNWNDLRNHWFNYFPIHDSLAQYPPQVVVYPFKIIVTHWANSHYLLENQSRRNTSCFISWGQNYPNIKAIQTHYKKGKLYTHISYEHICKNPEHISGKLNPKMHKKDLYAMPRGISYRHKRLVQY